MKCSRHETRASMTGQSAGAKLQKDNPSMSLQHRGKKKLVQSRLKNGGRDRPTSVSTRPETPERP
jgi:hypothetical protein